MIRTPAAIPTPVGTGDTSSNSAIATAEAANPTSPHLDAPVHRRVGGDELQLEPGQGDEDERGDDRQLPREGDAERRSRQRLDDDDGESREEGGRGDVWPARLAHSSDKE